MPGILTLTLHALVCVLLAWDPALAQTTYYTAQQETRRPGRTLPKGADSHTCQQATSPAMARATINGGIACLAPGDTLMIGSGHYDELILGYYNSTTCLSGDAAVQQPCAVLPNGADQDRPTRLIGN